MVRRIHWVIASLLLALCANTGTSAPAADVGPSMPKLRFEEHNFVIDEPQQPWMKQPDNKLPTGGVMMYTRNVPDSGFTLISEPIGVESTLNEQQLEEAVLRNLRQSATNVKVAARSPRVVNGIDGVQLDVLAHISTFDLSYRFWLCARQGYMYQIIGHSHVRDEARMRRLVDPLVDSFKLIDPKKVLHTAGIEPLGKYTSERFGYTIDLKDPSWRVWKDHDDSESEIGALLGEGSALTVTPVAFVGDAPEIEAIAPVLLSRMSIEFEKVKNLRRITEGTMQGYACEYGRVSEGIRFEYRFKILRGDGFAYMVATWTNDPKLNKEMDGWVASVTRNANEPVKADIASFSERERRTQATLISEIGLHYYYKAAYERSIKYFQAASALAPTDAVHPANEAQCYIMQGAYDKARDSAKKHLERLPDAPVLLCKYANALAETAKTDEAIAVYQKAFKGDYVNEHQFNNYMGYLRTAEKFAEALAAVEKYRKHVSDEAMLLLHSEILSELDKHDEAIDLLKSAQGQTGLNVEITSALAERYCDAERYNEGLEAAKSLQAAGFDSAYTHFLLGRAQNGLKWYREAKTSFETALSKDPESQRVKQYLQHVSGMLGEGDAASVRAPIDPVVVPPELLANIPTTQPATLGDHSAFVPITVRAMSFERGKQIKQTKFQRTQILNRQGVEDFSTLQFSFDPVTEQLYVNKVEVHDQSGKLISSGNPSAYYLVDDRSAGGVASTERTLNVPVPGLKPGYVLETQVTRRDRASSDRMRYDDWYFSGTLPTARSAYYFTGDVDSIRWAGALAPPPRKGERTITWSMDWPAVYRPEPMRQDLSRFLPMLAVSHGKATWQQEGKEYLDTIHDLMSPEQPVKDLARELTEGLDRPAQRIAAILRHVQQDYTYKAIEFGRRGRVPLKTSDVLHNRYGDCKDHAMLLRQLLECAGVEAKIALVSTGGVFFDELPSLDQFNHMIVYAPKLNRFFDCTEKEMDLAGGVPMGLAKDKALVLDEKDGGTIVEIPAYPADSAQVSSRRQLQIVNEGDVEVRETLSAVGYCASFLRAAFRVGDASDRGQTLQGMISPYADVTVRDVQIKNLDEVERPFIVEAKYLLRRCFRRDGESLAGSVPALWERYYYRMDHVEARRSPFAIRYPVTVRSSFALAVPEGYQLAAPPADAAMSSEFLDTKATYRTEALELKGESTAQQHPGEHPAAKYVQLEHANDRAISSLESRIALQAAKSR